MAERYKGYLRHYVSRQNQLAHLLKIHRNNYLPKLLIIEKSLNFIELKSSDFSSHKEQIREYIHQFSQKKRGEIERELAKLIACHKLMKQQKMYGPFSFSGGVKAYLLKDNLFICHESHLEYYAELDVFFSQNLTQIQKNVFPHLLLLEAHQKKQISNLIHPLLPKTLKILKDQKRSYSFLPLCAELLD